MNDAGSHVPAPGASMAEVGAPDASRFAAPEAPLVEAPGAWWTDASMFFGVVPMLAALAAVVRENRQGLQFLKQHAVPSAIYLAMGALAAGLSVHWGRRQGHGVAWGSRGRAARAVLELGVLWDLGVWLVGLLVLGLASVLAKADGGTSVSLGGTLSIAVVMSLAVCIVGAAPVVLVWRLVARRRSPAA